MNKNPKIYLSKDFHDEKSKYHEIWKNKYDYVPLQTPYILRMCLEPSVPLVSDVNMAIASASLPRSSSASFVSGMSECNDFTATSTFKTKKKKNTVDS